MDKRSRLLIRYRPVGLVNGDSSLVAYMSLLRPGDLPSLSVFYQPTATPAEIAASSDLLRRKFRHFAWSNRPRGPTEAENWRDEMADVARLGQALLKKLLGSTDDKQREQSAIGLLQKATEEPLCDVIVQDDFGVVPWELLYLPQTSGKCDVASGFVGFLHPVWRQITALHATHDPSSVRILGLWGNDLPGVLKERKALDRLHGPGTRHLETVPANLPHERKLEFLVERWNQFGPNAAHFGCHASYTGSGNHGPYLLVSNKFKLEESSLTDAGLAWEQCVLAVLNGCSTGSSATEGVHSFARTFAQLGQVAIGTQFEIEDDFAALFTENFYPHLIRGASVGESFRAARDAMVTGRPDDPEGDRDLRRLRTLVYSLWGDHEKRLFASPDVQDAA